MKRDYRVTFGMYCFLMGMLLDNVMRGEVIPCIVFMVITVANLIIFRTWMK